MRKYLLFIILAISIFSEAQTLSGTIMDSIGNPLPYATITLSDLRESATTNTKGRYVINHVPAGRHTLKLSYVGYESQTKEFDISGDSSMDFTMKETTVNMNEVLVLPDGESFALYLLKQVVENKKELKDILSSYDYTAKCRMETDTDMKAFSKSQLRTINLLLSLIGMKKIFVCMENHPDLQIEMAMDISYSDGKKTNSDIYVTDYMPENLTDEEKSAFTKRDHWGLGMNPYDDYYYTMSYIYEYIKKDIEKGKHPIDSLLTYEGCYNEAGHIIHIIRVRNMNYRNREIHIINGTWQIRRIIANKDMEDIRGTTYVEFEELLPGIFLPISDYEKSEWLLTKNDDFKKETDKLAQTDTTQLSKRQMKKHDKKQQFYDRVSEKPSWSYTYSNTYKYKTLKKSENEEVEIQGDNMK